MGRFFVFLLLLACGCVFALPSVNRSFLFDPGHPSQCRVRLEIHVEDAEQCGAFIISEDWSSGAMVGDASWNGVPFVPSRAGSRWRWLFGYPEGNPPWGSGVLEYTLVFPASFAMAKNSGCIGVVRSAGAEICVAGESDLLDCTDISGVVEGRCTLELSPGWNMLWLPRPVAMEELPGLELRSMMTLDAGSGSYIRLPGERLPDNVPVWAYLSGEGSGKLELGWAQALGRGEKAEEAIETGWRMGRTRDAGEDVDSAGEKWEWSDGRFRRFEYGADSGLVFFWKRHSLNGGAGNE